MINRLFYIVYIGCSFLLCGCLCNTSNRTPVENFFRKTERSSFHLSPSGASISFIQDFNDVKNIFVLDVASGSVRRVTSEADEDVRFAVWANDEELIYMNDRKGSDSVSLKSVNKSNTETRYILPPTKSKLRWVGPDKAAFDEILIGLNDRDSSVFDIYRLNIHTGRMHMIAKNPGNIVSWCTDNQGVLRLAMASDGLTNTILMRQHEREPFRPLLTHNFKTDINPIGFSAQDGRRFFATSNAGRDKLALVEIDAQSGKEVRLLFEHPNVDISETGYSPEDGSMVFVGYNTWQPETYFFDPHLKKVHQRLQSKFKDYTVNFLSIDSSFNRFVIRTYTDVDPGAVYFFDYQKDDFLKLTDINPYLEPRELAKMKPIQYKARDGMIIHGYLTLPKNSSGSKLPTIVIPHNGPSSRNVWGFNTEVQFFASLGYAVLQVNYRGSTGYGKDFWIAGFKQWGKAIQDDITDGTKWLIDKGVADPHRIGIYGFSFGGYSALHAACFNPDLYACAASYSGMTNLYTYLKEVPPYYTLYLKKFYEMLGDPEVDGDYFRTFSPIFNADRVKSPIFIVQGGKDSRSNVNETNHFVKELKENGVDVQYFLKPDEGHHLKDEQNRIEMYKALAAFFERNLKK